jgi:hypothetical protein
LALGPLPVVFVLLAVLACRVPRLLRASSLWISPCDIFGHFACALEEGGGQILDRTVRLGARGGARSREFALSGPQP